MEKPIIALMSYGLDGEKIIVESNASNGLPNITIIGLGNKIIEESKERIRSALSTYKFEIPRKRIVINLAPADIVKNSPCLDLAIAVAILKLTYKPLQIPDKSAFIGELGLDGSVRPVRGIIGMLLSGKKKGLNRFYIPAANLSQAQSIPDITVFPVSTIKELFENLTIREERQISTTTPFRKKHITSNPFGEIAGQDMAKRALCIAAAGGHNVLLTGPPGTGKSMLAKALPSLLPPMVQQEILEITQIHSLALRNYDQLITERPFRAPHHTASSVAITGGGAQLKPGEISLSHNGVLFLDELPEFKRSTIEALRQPLEDGTITVSRAKDSLSFPANFILVATANPCPCGYYNSNKECICTSANIQRYMQKLSGPILDRIDLHVSVHEVEYKKLLISSASNESSKLREKVQIARTKQCIRYKTNQTNSALTNSQIKEFANLHEDARTFLDQAANRLKISARNYMRIVKVSRTIADLDGSDCVKKEHISEAFQYRSQPVIPNG